MQSEHRQLAGRLLEKREIKCGRLTFVSGRIGICKVNSKGEAYIEVLRTLALTKHFSYRIEGETVTIRPYK